MTAPSLYDLIVMSVIGTAGTGDVTLGAPVAPYLGFSNYNTTIADGTVVSYSITDGQSNSEVGHATYRTPTASSTTYGKLTGRTVLASTNSGSAIDATANSKIRCSVAAEDFVGNGSLNLVSSVFGRTGAVVGAEADYDSFYASYSAAQSLTDAQKAQARTNLGAAYGNGFVNVLRNPHMDVAQRGTSGTVAAGTTAYTLDGWQISATGAGAVWSQQKNANIAGNVLRISCATGLTACTLQARIEDIVACLIRGHGGAPSCTAQFFIYNNSGASITAQIAADYPTVANTFGTVTNDLAATNLQTIANGSGAVASYSFTPSNNIDLGYQLRLLFGGALNASSGYVEISCADFRPTPGVATGLNSNPPPPELRPVGVELPSNCRYLYVINEGVSNSALPVHGFANSTTNAVGCVQFPTAMRATPAGTCTTGSLKVLSGSAPSFTSLSGTIATQNTISTTSAVLDFPTASGLTAGYGAMLYSGGGSGQLLFSAEL